MIVDLIRHGVTDSNLNNRFNGQQDESLSTQALVSLKGIHFDARSYDAIYCSPLKRCTETADALKIQDYILEPRIVERHLGIFQGMTPGECEAQYPVEFERFRKLDGEYRIPGGESREDNLQRLLMWVESLGKESRVLAITHGGTLDFFYRSAKSLPTHGGDKVFAGDNAALSGFDIRWPAVKLLTFNKPLSGDRNA